MKKSQDRLNRYNLQLLYNYPLVLQRLPETSTPPSALGGVVFLCPFGRI
jgi:hypothetical protein